GASQGRWTRPEKVIEEVNRIAEIDEAVCVGVEQSAIPRSVERLSASKLACRPAEENLKERDRIGDVELTIVVRIADPPEAARRRVERMGARRPQDIDARTPARWLRRGVRIGGGVDELEGVSAAVRRRIPLVRPFERKDRFPEPISDPERLAAVREATFVLAADVETFIAVAGQERFAALDEEDHLARLKIVHTRRFDGKRELNAA